MSTDGSEDDLIQRIVSVAVGPAQDDRTQELSVLLARTSLEAVALAVAQVVATLATDTAGSGRLARLGLLREAASKSGDQSLVDTIALGGMRELVDREAAYAEAVEWGVACLGVVSDHQLRVVLGDLAICETMLGRHAESISYAEQAVVAAERDGDQYWVARNLGLLGTALTRTGEFTKSLAAYDEAIRLGSQLAEFDVMDKYCADRELVRAAVEEEAGNQ